MMPDVDGADPIDPNCGYREDIDCPQCLRPPEICAETNCGRLGLSAPDITPANAYAQADKARLLRMDGTPARYGQRIHPDMALVLDHASINALIRSLRLMHSQATDTAAYALEAMIDDFECMGLIHQLRADDADQISILCDNAEGPPNNALIANGDWTGYEDLRIDGESLIQCLRAAVNLKGKHNGL